MSSNRKTSAMSPVTSKPIETAGRNWLPRVVAKETISEAPNIRAVKRTMYCKCSADEGAEREGEDRAHHPAAGLGEHGCRLVDEQQQEDVGDESGDEQAHRDSREKLVATRRREGDDQRGAEHQGGEEDHVL